MKFDFGVELLTKDKVKEKISDQQIYEFYLNKRIDFNTKYNSPYRDDKNPSLSFLVSQNGDILWRDWGDFFQEKSEDVFNFVMTIKDCSFAEALEYINNDMGLGLSSLNSFIKDKKTIIKDIPKKREVEANNIEKLIEVQTQFFTVEDREYWKQYYIDLATLVKYNVSSIKYCWINGTLVRTYSRSNPVYSYKFITDKKTYYKIYSPYDKKRKWMTNATKDIIQGYDNLTFDSDLLIITKSLKDIMVLNKLGYESISLQSEGVLIDLNFLSELKEKYKDIIIFYDNDLTGIAEAQKFSDKHKLKVMYIPKKYDEKDISDYVKSYGLEEGKSLLNKIISDAKVYNNI